MNPKVALVLTLLPTTTGCLLGADTGPLEAYFSGNEHEATDAVLSALQSSLSAEERLELAKTEWGEVDDVWKRPVVPRALAIAAQARGGPAASCEVQGAPPTEDDCRAFKDHKAQALGGVEEVFFNRKGRDLPTSCFYDPDPDRCDAAVLTVLVNDPTRESDLLARCDPAAAGGGGACGDPCGLRNGFSYTCPPTPNCAAGCTNDAVAADATAAGLGIPAEVLANGGVWSEYIGTGTAVYDFDVSTCQVTVYLDHELCSAEPPTRVNLRTGAVTDAWIYCYNGGNSCTFCKEQRCTVTR